MASRFSELRRVASAVKEAGYKRTPRYRKSWDYKSNAEGHKEGRRFSSSYRNEKGQTLNVHVPGRASGESVTRNVSFHKYKSTKTGFGGVGARMAHGKGISALSRQDDYILGQAGRKGGHAGHGR